MSSARGEVRARMLQSLVESQGALREQRISLRLLLQNCDSEELTGFATTAPEFVRPVAVAGRVPLSIARNMLLRPLIADGSIGPDALVAFPDDDCWYPDGFLSQVVALFARDAALDFWFCRYASQPMRDSFAAADPTGAHTGEIVRNAEDAPAGTLIEARLAHGHVRAKVQDS